MREIKFRAWDNKDKKMHEVLGYHLKANKVIVSNKPFGNYSLWDFEIMQFTGLKDKTGREIYEGDILCPDDSGDNFPENYDEKTDEYKPCGKYIVKWMGEYPAFDIVNLDGSGLGMEWNPFSDPNTSFEVIGNIYENPELLENK